MRFFDQYPRFYETSRTFPLPDRLHKKHAALIEANRAHIEGKRVLDLGAHDGRWCFAASKAGAVSVLGVEARSDLVAKARENTRIYSGGAEFICEDVLKFLDRALSDGLRGNWDTIFCFGLFYHLYDHRAVLRAMRALEPRVVILDTTVSDSSEPVVTLNWDDTSIEGNAWDPERRYSLVGIPSIRAVEMLAMDAGFRASHQEWERFGLESSPAVKDYSDWHEYKSNRTDSERKASVRARRAIFLLEPE